MKERNFIIAVCIVLFITGCLMLLVPINKQDPVPEVRVLRVDGCDYIYVAGKYIVHSASCTNKIHHELQLAQ